MHLRDQASPPLLHLHKNHRNKRGELIPFSTRQACSRERRIKQPDWLATLTSSPPNHIRFLLVRTKKIAKFKNRKISKVDFNSDNFYNSVKVQNLTSERGLGRDGSGAEIMQKMCAVYGLARTTRSHEHQGLVGIGSQHIPVCCLSRGINMRRHVFLFTSTEHLYHLGD